MDDMNQEFANLTPEQRQLVELMLRQREDPTPASPNTITRQRTVDTAPLSFAQQRLWFLEQLDPGNAAYSLPLAMRVDGKLDVNALTQSLNEVVARHDVLRTTFALADEGNPTQIVAPTLIIPLPMIDLPAMSLAEQAERVRQLVLEEAGQPFSLEHGPLMRASLLRLSAHEHVLLLTMHHSVSDGWSISLLMREMAVLYHAFSNNRPSPLSSLPIQYADYAIWQRKWLTGEVLEQQLGYWKRQLSGDPPVLDLPTDHPRPLVQTFQGAITKFQIPRDLTDRLKALGQQHSATLFMVLLAAFQTLLHRYTGQSDFVVGTPIANRNRAETEDLIGFFVNMLALRMDTSGNPTFAELLQRVRKITLGAYAHQDLPFERLIDELQLKRDVSRTPLFQVVLVLQNMPLTTIEVAGLKLTPFDLANSGTSKFDLTMTLTETPDGLRGMLEYCTDLFDAATMERFLGHYQILLAGIVANPQQHLSELPLLAEAERHQLLVEWNTTETEYPQGECIHERFEAQVEKTPEAVAVVFDPNTPSTSSPVPAVHRPASGAGLAQAGQAPGAGEQQLTYRELNARANQLAHYLRSQGVGPDVLVGICVERSLEMIVGLLGILKAGGAYLPIDPAYPKARMKFMAEDGGVNILLTQSKLVPALPELDLKLVYLDSEPENVFNNHSQKNLKIKSCSENLAYVIYTSGSTGKPKGVEIEHRNLNNLVSWHQSVYALSAQDKATQLAGFSFDATVWEIWPYLTIGACLYFPPSHASHLSPQMLQSWLVSQKITVSFLPTPLAEATLPLEWPKDASLHILLTGGDRLHIYPSSNLSFTLYNNYGPTENTVVTTFTKILAGPVTDKLPSIGRPISNAQVYILDVYQNPVPVGVAGELYIGGDSLARGYHNRPDLTAEKFIPNPFAAEAATVDGGPWIVEKHGLPSTVHGRLYRTGDLVRYLPDGNIEYLGRIDQQVKIRGFRIELGEIEAALVALPEVRDAIVLAGEYVPGEKRLVAYLVAQAGQSLPDVAALRSQLMQSLPDYMVPAYFMVLESLPLTPNGKVDRHALPIPDGARPELKVAFAAPGTSAEKALAEIWSRVLGVKQIGIHDNFFELGGDSLLSLQVIAQAARVGLRFTPQQFFLHQTITELAAVAVAVIEAPAEQHHHLTGLMPLTAPQNWFFENIGEHTGWGIRFWAYEVPSIWGQAPSLTAQVFKHLLAHHDELRAYFVHQEIGWQKAIAEPGEMSVFTSIDIAYLDPAEQDRALQAASDALHRELYLSIPPLVRISLFYLGDSRPARLLIIADHLVWDGFTSGIVLDDFRMAYQQLARGEVIQLSPKSTSVNEYVEYMQDYVRSDEMRRELDEYWLTIPWDQMAALPVDDPTGKNPRIFETIDTVEVALNAEETHILQMELQRIYQAQVSDAVLMALMQVLTRWTGRSHQLIGWVDTGRGTAIPGQVDLDVSRTAGWLGFDRYLPLENVTAHSPAESLKAIQEQLQRIPNHGIGWYIMRHYGDAEMVEKVKPLINDEMVVMVNYIGTMIDSPTNQIEIMRLVNEPKGVWCYPETRDAHPRLFITPKIVGGCFSATWEYNLSEYHRATIERLAFEFKETLRALIVAHIPSI